MSNEEIAAGELLLELMVRIAAQPDQWEKVHQLLQKIDKDLSLSKNVLNDLKKKHLELQMHNKDISEIHVNKKEHLSNHLNLTKEKNQKSTVLDEEIEKVSSTQKEKNTKPFNGEVWPNFDQESKKTNPKPIKVAYPKNFAYHRVTGKPIYLNKNPKAYIAVSVVAPKLSSSRSQEEDINLENELHQLKPWTHEQNLKNMASIRSRWFIQSDQNKEPVPTL